MVGLSLRSGGTAGTARPASPRQAKAEAHEKALGAYVTGNDMPTNAHRRERLTNKVLLTVCGVSLMLNVLMAVSIAELLPLYKVVPLFVTFSDKADQVVRIEPPSGTVPGIAILTQNYVREYVVMRNTIGPDQAETQDRWGTRVRLMSTPRIFEDFKAETAPIYEQMKNGSYTRQIEVKTILQPEPGLFQVEFDSFDHKQGTGLSDQSDTRTTWVALLRVAYEERRITSSQRMLNPLGFTVIDYSVARKH